jgi:hypothetical protein
MGFWHTGYAEFHEPGGWDGTLYTPPPPVRYSCDVCAESFAQLELLRRHRFEQHPVRQPALLLRGKPVGALRVVLKTPLHASDVAVEDAAHCFLNGRPLELSALGPQLSALRSEFAVLELRNQDVSMRYQLDFIVADEADLAGVEAAFLRLASTKVLSIDAISRFNDDCRAFSSAMPYCDGISHYLYGVMAKERSPDSGLQHQEYVQRFLRSTDELSGFDRPLARCIRALVAFHFNQFEDAESLAPEGALRHASGAFAGLLQGLPWHFDVAFSPAPGSAVEDLLTDQETLQILADASAGLVVLKARAAELLQYLRRATTVGYDQMKRSLLAAEALAARDDLESREVARRLARELSANTHTSTWATGMLERLATS